ncbi:MAG TPA: uroporphyrinogen-III synthase, partial [Burkholderiaceae bacterium]|nr:uroporphyrinogen-III synthase [Burkholderiaceae bacterium]
MPQTEPALAPRTTMRVIVTRPAAQAADWVAWLRAQGIDALALPLIAIAPIADATPLVQAWNRLAAYRLVVFVSPNAAERFFAQRPAAQGWPPGVLAGSPGPGTTRALLALGVPSAQLVEPAQDAPQFDSETLWAQMRGQDWHAAQVLIVRGDGGREWLAQTLRAAGARVAQVAAYRRTAPTFDAAQAGLLQAALAEPARHLWLFSSSEAIEHLLASPLVG